MDTKHAAERAVDQQPVSPEHPQEGPSVTITIDNVVRTIHRGHQTVAEIKQVGKVPLAYDLEEVVDGVLKPLPDDGAVTLKGGEVFVSHPKDAASS
jgi:hypothetical protein